MKLNIALIGYGKWGKVVINEINKNKNYTLKAIVSLSKNFKSKEINIYKNINELYNDTEIDCIYVAANPEVNFEVLNLFKSKKTPLMLEKPFSQSFVKGKKILHLIVNNKIIVLTNLPNICADTYQFTKKLILNNKNKIKKITICEGGFGPKNNHIHPILDWGIHSFTYILSIFNQSKFTKINYREIKKNNHERYNVSRFDLELENNILVKILTGNAFKKKIRLLKIKLKNGDIIVNNFIKHEVSINNSVVFSSKKRPLENLLNKFALTIKNKNFENDLNQLKKSLESIKIIEKYI